MYMQPKLQLWHNILENMYSHFTKCYTYVNEVLITKHMSEEQIFKFSQFGLWLKLTTRNWYLAKSVKEKSVVIFWRMWLCEAVWPFRKYSRSMVLKVWLTTRNPL
jgi:hypothetical protein